MGKEVTIGYYITYLPGIINLEKNEIYTHKYNNKVYGVVLKDCKTSVHVIDYENKIVKNEKGKYKLNKPIEEISEQQESVQVSPSTVKTTDSKKNTSDDNSHQEHRLFFDELYSEIIVLFELDESEENTSEGASISYEEILKAKEVLDKFLRFYKNVASAVAINSLNNMLDRDTVSFMSATFDTVEDKNINFFDFIDLNLAEQNKRPVAINTRIFVQDHEESEKNKEVIGNELAERFGLDLELEDYEVMVDKAAEELYLRANAKYTYLESFFAIEIFLSRMIHKYKKEIEKATRKQLEDYSRNTTVKKMIEKELPGILDNSYFEEDEKKLLLEVLEINKKRNGVVHRGETVNEVEAEKALKTIDKCIRMLKSKFNHVFS